jgi:hypothetical protein
MDRSDEKRDRYGDDEPVRTGDTLGLGGAAVPKRPGDPSASDDPESVRRRRERMRGDEDRAGSTDEAHQDGSGATGIDMGAGGEGTDIER